MIIDYLSGPHPAEIDVDLRVIGAGGAGIAIGHALIDSPVRVCLLESGGLTGEQRSQVLYEGDSMGPQPFDPGISRIAGSSVFPTGRWAFPTSTIVALSLRLAHKLKGILPTSAATGSLKGSDSCTGRNDARS